MLFLYTPLCRPSSGLVSSCASRRRGIDTRGAVYTTFQVVARLQSMANSPPYPGKGVSGCVHEEYIVFHTLAIGGRQLFFKIGSM